MFQPDSSSSHGTLYSAKILLNAKNATSKAGAQYYDNSELFDKLVAAYVVLGELN